MWKELSNQTLRKSPSCHLANFILAYDDSASLVFLDNFKVCGFQFTEDEGDIYTSKNCQG